MARRPRIRIPVRPPENAGDCMWRIRRNLRPSAESNWPVKDVTDSNSNAVQQDRARLAFVEEYPASQKPENLMLVFNVVHERSNVTCNTHATIASRKIDNVQTNTTMQIHRHHLLLRVLLRRLGLNCR